MAAQITERCTLVRAFVEFEMLPDLLAQVPQPGIPNLPSEMRGFGKPEIDEAEAIRAWTEHDAVTGANIDHVEEGDLPASVPLNTFLAEDAWALASRLEWVSPSGVTEIGNRLAQIAARPSRQRTEADFRTLVQTVAASVAGHYVGKDGRQVVPLLQEAAATLAATEHVWAGIVPGSWSASSRR